MATRMLPSSTDHRNHDQNLSGWSVRGGVSSSPQLRMRHRTMQTIVSVDERPPAGLGDLDLHTPMSAPDPLDRLHRGSVDFRLRPTRAFDRAIRAPRSLEFSILIADAEVSGAAHRASLRWNLDSRSDRFGDLSTHTADPDAPWRTRSLLTPDHAWHEFQFSIDPRNFSSWLAVDRQPVTSELVLAPSTHQTVSGLTIRFRAFDELLPADESRASFAFRNWETASPDHRRWDGG